MQWQCNGIAFIEFETSVSQQSTRSFIQTAFIAPDTALSFLFFFTHFLKKYMTHLKIFCHLQ